MKHPAFLLDSRRRTVVLQALLSACRKPGWTIWAAHVRMTHIHVVVEAEDRPEHILRELKAVATAQLQRQESQRPLHPWSRHGSTRYLWNDEQFYRALAYVAEEQGEPMALYVRAGCFGARPQQAAI